jgi:hypothetical protein
VAGGIDHGNKISDRQAKRNYVYRGETKRGGTEMKNWLKLFFAILKDERGIWPWVIPAAISAGSAILGGMSKKGEEEEEIYDPYAGLRGDWTKWLEGKIGTSTPYQRNPAFDIQQPPVEEAAKSTILGRLGNLPTAEEYKGKVEASKTQQIAREKERAETQRLEEQDMYNRLGLVSSTPWMTRAGELGEESLGRQKDIETGMDIYGLEYGLGAEKTMSDIGAQWAGLGSVLGGQQAGYQKWGQQMSMNDLIRMIEEEMGYGQMAAGVLGGNPPERTVTTAGDDIFSTLGGIGGNIGSQMLLKALGLG